MLKDNQTVRFGGPWRRGGCGESADTCISPVVASVMRDKLVLLRCLDEGAGAGVGNLSWVGMGMKPGKDFCILVESASGALRNGVGDILGQTMPSNQGS